MKTISLNYLKIIAFTLCAFASGQLYAQVNVSVGNKTFGACEIAEASITGESINIRLLEHNLDKFDGDNVDLPASLGLLLSVEHVKNLKFPVSPEDGLTIQLSDLQFSQMEQADKEKQLGNIDQSKMKSEKEALQSKTKNIEAKAKEITQQMMEGKISPEEAGRQIEALTSGVISDIESSTANVEIKELEEQAQFSIAFYDTETLEELRMYSGTLRIERFNEKEFVATFEGQYFAECLTSRNAESAAKGDSCQSTDSQLMPGAKVLREGNIKISISFTIADFYDYR